MAKKKTDSPREPPKTIGAAAAEFRNTVQALLVERFPSNARLVGHVMADLENDLSAIQRRLAAELR